MVTDLKHYLDYFRTTRSPGYAVLVTGAWGIGKTHQVKSCLSDAPYLYVSLFGMQSADAIRLSVMSHFVASSVVHKQKTLAKAIPGLEEALTSLDPFKPFGRLVQGVAESLLSEKLRDDYVLVFDDLERSCMKTKDLLGVINHYIEDLGSRVIIICNEDEAKPAFPQLKEKLIGQTIHITPQLNDAYKAFTSDLDTSASKSFVTKNKELILRVFADSGCFSLRILRHILHDLGRLHNVLTDNHLANSSAIVDLVSIFCARDIEVRAGHIDEGDLRQKAENPYAFMYEEQAEGGTPNSMSRILESEAKFPLINFQSDILNVHVIVDMLIRGRFIKEHILESLNSSVHFQTPDDLPPWKVIIQFEELDNATVERAIELLKNQLQDYQVTVIGEIFHTFSIMMTLSENNVIDEKISDILSYARSYVDYLVKSKRLSTVDELTLRTGGINHGYDGYAYHVPDASARHFKELQEYVMEGNRRVCHDRLPEAAEELLKIMTENAQQFLENICHTNSDERNPFASVPVLMHVDPARFVECWRQCPVGDWRTITTALDIRYEHLLQHQSLKEERDWAISVYRTLQRQAKAAEGLTAWRLRRAIPKALEILAGDADMSELQRS